MNAESKLAEIINSQLLPETRTVLSYMAFNGVEKFGTSHYRRIGLSPGEYVTAFTECRIGSSGKGRNGPTLQALGVGVVHGSREITMTIDDSDGEQEAVKID